MIAWIGFNAGPSLNDRGIADAAERGPRHRWYAGRPSRAGNDDGIKRTEQQPGDRQRPRRSDRRQPAAQRRNQRIGRAARRHRIHQGQDLGKLLIRGPVQLALHLGHRGSLEIAANWVTLGRHGAELLVSGYDVERAEPGSPILIDAHGAADTLAHFELDRRVEPLLSLLRQHRQGLADLNQRHVLGCNTGRGAPEQPRQLPAVKRPSRAANDIGYTCGVQAEIRRVGCRYRPPERAPSSGPCRRIVWRAPPFRTSSIRIPFRPCPFSTRR